MNDYKTIANPIELTPLVLKSLCELAVTITEKIAYVSNENSNLVVSLVEL